MFRKSITLVEGEVSLRRAVGLLEECHEKTTDARSIPARVFTYDMTPLDILQNRGARVDTPLGNLALLGDPAAARPSCLAICGCITPLIGFACSWFRQEQPSWCCCHFKGQWGGCCLVLRPLAGYGQRQHILHCCLHLVSNLHQSLTPKRRLGLQLKFCSF